LFKIASVIVLLRASRSWHCLHTQLTLVPAHSQVRCDLNILESSI